MSTAGDIDPKKNYYAVLELSERATLEEIKSSYIKLALLYHPDTGKQKASGEVDVGAKFRNISEAFTVLSKPALRERYHALRGIKDGADVESFANSAAAGDYSAQKIHFTNMVQHRANADDIKNMTDKYKSQRWQKMTLAEKKLHRRVPLQKATLAVGGSSVLWGVVLFVSGIAYIKAKNSS